MMNSRRASVPSCHATRTRDQPFPVLHRHSLLTSIAHLLQRSKALSNGRSKREVARSRETPFFRTNHRRGTFIVMCADELPSLQPRKGLRSDCAAFFLIAPRDSQERQESEISMWTSTQHPTILCKRTWTVSAELEIETMEVKALQFKDAPTQHWPKWIQREEENLEQRHARPFQETF